MGVYSEYLSKNMSFDDIAKERKACLKKISELRGNRDILVYAADIKKSGNGYSTGIDYGDILPFCDQLSNLKKNKIDIILETPGGYATVVEDLVASIRNKYDHVGIIIPGYAKSAGTIFAMSGDEILMGELSALGPIDAQVFSNGKRFSADAFLDMFNKIKEDFERSERLNPFFLGLLRNLSLGEIQHFENAQMFSRKLVTEWLSKYKFKYWDKHASTGKPVTEEDKERRAKDIASTLCKHSKWLTHERSIKIKQLEDMRLKVIDYSKEKALNDAITRYYSLLQMTFDTTIYKIYETIDSQIYRFNSGPDKHIPIEKNKNICFLAFTCPQCGSKNKFQINLDEKSPLNDGCIPFPISNNKFICPQCNLESDLSRYRLVIEAQNGKKFV